MNQITAKVTYGNSANYDSLDQWQKDANPWTVELRYKGRRMTVHYWTGQGITDDPTAADVLGSLVSDASSADQPFEDWAGDYGYDTDSRTAERTYNAVQEQTRKLRALLGSNFDEITRKDEDELKAYCR